MLCACSGIIALCLNPTPAQEPAFGRIAGCCRFIWNLTLE
jgi:hypothetical protein